MPNLVAPKGFVPVRHLDGSAYNGQFVPFLIQSTDGTATFVGDIVIHGGTAGAAGVVVAGMDMEGVPACIRGSAGTTGQDIVGVVRGFLVDPTNLALKYRLASTNRVALVVTDLSVVYQAQEDAVTTPLTAAMVGMNAAYTTTAGSTTTGISAECIQSTSQATTATLPLKILGLAKVPGNAFNTAGAGTDPGTFEVVLNTSFFATNTVGKS